MDFFWKPLACVEGQTYYWKINDVEFWIRKQDDEWRVAQRFISPPADVKEIIGPIETESVLDPDLEWVRYIAGKDADELILTPVPPDIPAVVNPRSHIDILPHSKAMFFVKLPLWIQVHVQHSQKFHLSDIPTIQSSKTWFGSPTNGVLSCDVEFHAKREVRPWEPGSKIEIITPVSIRNNAEESLEMKDMNLRCEHLKVYQGKEHLWTNTIHIQYYGEYQPSKVSYEEKKPGYEPLTKNVTAPRIRLKQDLLSRSFSFLKNFTEDK